VTAGSPPWQRLRASSPVGRSSLFGEGSGLPPYRRLQVPPRRVAQGAAPGQRPRTFPCAGWLGVSSCRRPEAAPCRWLRGFPRCRRLWVSSCRSPRSSLSRWLRASRASGPQCPLPGGTESALRHWLGVAPLPVTRSFLCADGRGVSPLAGGSGFPLRLLPFPVVKKFLRLTVRPHKRFPPAISRFFGRPQAIHS
jgi:hypothetical protein